MVSTSWAQVDQPSLEGEAVELDAVVVTAAGFEQSIAQAPASISVLTSADLGATRINSLADVLSTVEGIDVGASAGKTGGLNISMRGMPSDYTLILVDGRRQNAAGNITPNGFGETSSSFLPPASAIDRVEVIRGPMSTLYGSDAMGGVVNIITRRGESAWSGSVTAGGTLQGDSDFGNTAETNFYATGPLFVDKLGLTLRGSFFNRQASDLSYLDENGEELEVSKRGPSPVGADVYSAGARLNLLGSRDHDLWFDADINRQTYDNSEAQLGTLGVRGYAEELKFNRSQLTLAHTWRLGDVQLESSLMQNETETIGRVIPSGTPGKEPGSARDLTNENIVFDVKALVNTNESHSLVIGAQWWDAEMVDGVAPAPYQQTQWALFVEDEWKLAESLRLTLGARLDDHSQFGQHTSPRAYAVWNATSNWSFKGGVSKGFKVPRLDQIAEGIIGFTGQGTIPNIGSPDLEPETSVTTELVAMYDNLEGFRAGVTVFHNSFDDKIARGPGLLNATWASDPNRPGSVDYGYWPLVDEFSQSINVDEAETYGMEATTRIDFSSRLSLKANYTYTESEQKSGESAGQPLYATPKHMLNSRLKWNAGEDYSFWLSGEYRSERYRSPDRSSTSLAKDTWGNYRAYSLFHLGGDWEINESLTLNATIYNLFDKNFVDYRPYVSNTGTGAISYTNLYANSQEPRRLWLTATYSF
ncbi:TonB-dependent receptor [Pelagicoccus sp. SDUM812005]|uniref:TonB-dependent receptor domain-containing protein n=1 Tax=Pelagicoccus sp. SDUM812005 TaxID=3041257 RepID=UPI00280CEA73|nr:TonB-dependent receptor [Pelagicoccus sp. SDUM812005]MDQ8179640.1 TonB-dependent receptor [Pelagicoccus sp. SDUM812005]